MEEELGNGVCGYCGGPTQPSDPEKGTLRRIYRGETTYWRQVHYEDCRWLRERIKAEDDDGNVDFDALLKALAR